MKYLLENVEGLIARLRIYEAAALGLSLLVVMAARELEWLVALLLCVAGVPVSVCCAYYLSEEPTSPKPFLRLELALVTGLACGILMSDSGLRARSINLADGLFLGLAAAILTYTLAMLADTVATPIFRRIRSFDVHNHCHRCGYDLTGLPARRCPECGTEF